MLSCSEELIDIVLLMVVIGMGKNTSRARKNTEVDRVDSRWRGAGVGNVACASRGTSVGGSQQRR